jgi:Flp pilus assembly protein TadD
MPLQPVPKNRTYGVMTLNGDLQLALGQLNQGRYKQALKLARAGGKRHKRHPAFANIEGIALSSLGKNRDAVGAFQKALRLDPEFNDARKNLAQALILLQKDDAALKLLNKYLSALPGDAGAWYLLGQTQMNLGDFDGAVHSAGQSLKLVQNQARVYNLRAIAQNCLGDEAQALADFEAALRCNPDDVETLVNISLPLARQTRFAEADQAARKAVALAPQHRGARLRLAMHLLESGDNDGARDAFHAVLDLSPGDPEAIEQLALLNGPSENEGLFKLARKTLDALPKQSPGAANLHFALARMALQRQDEAGYSQHLAQANGSLASRHPYDVQADEALFARLMARFSEPVERVAHSERRKPTPIYVLGLPRSGTTLTEAVLGAHPRVKALGERAVAGFLLADFMDSEMVFDPEHCRAFVAEDSARLPKLPESVDFYVDKMPENYRLIGFLATAYPDSPIVHVRRDPRDTALSMWQAHFSGQALGYSYDLETMAHRFNLYARLMKHWHSVFPGRIHEVRYESLVSDIDAQSHDLAGFCGLDWIEKMARPDQAAGQVLTLSAAQLRQPVHNRSVGRWQHHSDMLAPLIRKLDPDLWPEIQD